MISDETYRSECGSLNRGLSISLSGGQQARLAISERNLTLSGFLVRLRLMRLLAQKHCQAHGTHFLHLLQPPLLLLL